MVDSSDRSCMFNVIYQFADWWLPDQFDLGQIEIPKLCRQAFMVVFELLHNCCALKSDGRELRKARPVGIIEHAAEVGYAQHATVLGEGFEHVVGQVSGIICNAPAGCVGVEDWGAGA